MTSHFMTTTIIKYMNAQRDGDVRTRDAYESAYSAIKVLEMSVQQFCVSVWPMVHKQVNDERLYNGMRVDVDGLTILAFAMCGRIRIQVERGDAWCAGHGAEEDFRHGFGLHGIGATVGEAIVLWDDAIKAFENGAQLVGAPNVGI